MLEKKFKLVVLKNLIELPENTGHLSDIRKTIYKTRSLTER